MQSVTEDGERSDGDTIQAKKQPHASASSEVGRKRWLSPERRLAGVPGKTSGVPRILCDDFQPLHSGFHFLAKSVRFLRTVEAQPTAGRTGQIGCAWKEGVCAIHRRIRLLSELPQ